MKGFRPCSIKVPWERFPCGSRAVSLPQNIRRVPAFGDGVTPEFTGFAEGAGDQRAAAGPASLRQPSTLKAPGPVNTSSRNTKQ